jgi:hypothetical protein
MAVAHQDLMRCVGISHNGNTLPDLGPGSSPTMPHGRVSVVSMFVLVVSDNEHECLLIKLGNYLYMCMSKYNATCFSFCKEHILIFSK